MSEVYGRSLGGSSSETKARGENPKFNLARRDEREAAAHEEPPHRPQCRNWPTRGQLVARGELTHEPAPPYSVLTSTSVWQVSSLARPRAAADSTVKMVTNGLEHRHPAADGQPPPGRRLHLGGAGRRRRRRLHLRDGSPTLQWACASMDRRAPRPPAAACFGSCLAGHLKEVLRCAWYVLG